MHCDSLRSLTHCPLSFEAAPRFKALENHRRRASCSMHKKRKNNDLLSDAVLHSLWLYVTSSWSLSRHTLGERTNPLQSPDIIHTFLPTGNLKSPISLTCTTLDCGGKKPEYLADTRPDMGRPCKPHTKRRSVGIGTRLLLAVS